MNDLTRDEKLSDIQDWFFTFGYDSPYRDNYVKINGTWSDAREKMFKLHGKKWAFQYSTREFEPQIEKYKYKELIRSQDTDVFLRKKPV